MSTAFYVEEEGMKNLRVRQAAAQARIKLWEVAEELGITDATFSRKLRRELTEKEEQHILEIIKRIKEEENAVVQKDQ